MTRRWLAGRRNAPSASDRSCDHIALGKTGVHHTAVDVAQIVGAAFARARRQDHAGWPADGGGIAAPHAQGMADEPRHGLSDGEIDAFGRAGGDLKGNTGRAPVSARPSLPPVTSAPTTSATKAARATMATTRCDMMWTVNPLLRQDCGVNRANPGYIYMGRYT